MVDTLLAMPTVTAGAKPIRWLSTSPHCVLNRVRKLSELMSNPRGTHTLRRTNATLIYRRTKNLRAAQLLLGHTRLESAVRYLGIEVDDALEIAEQTET